MPRGEFITLRQDAISAWIGKRRPGCPASSGQIPGGRGRGDGSLRSVPFSGLPPPAAHVATDSAIRASNHRPVSLGGLDYMRWIAPSEKDAICICP
jgi:hypothetical protein